MMHGQQNVKFYISFKKLLKITNILQNIIIYRI